MSQTPTSIVATFSLVLDVSDMAELWLNGLVIPILFPIDVDGLATITLVHLGIRFGLFDTSLWMERKIFDPLTLLLFHTLYEVSKLFDDGFAMRRLISSKYRVYGLTDSQMVVPTELLTPPGSSTCTISTPSLIHVKIESNVDIVIELLESYMVVYCDVMTTSESHDTTGYDGPLCHNTIGSP